VSTISSLRGALPVSDIVEVSSTYLTSAFMRTRVSLNRIAHFLREGEELDDHPRQAVEGEDLQIQGQFQWREASPSQAFTLNVEEPLQFPKGKMTVVAGGSFSWGQLRSDMS
jgi:hypothetical protein